MSLEEKMLLLFNFCFKITLEKKACINIDICSEAVMGTNYEVILYDNRLISRSMHHAC